MNEQETIEHGHRVRMALEIVEPAIDGLRDKMMRMLIDTPPMQTDVILSLHAKIQAVEALKDDLRQAVSDGDAASAISENEQ